MCTGEILNVKLEVNICRKTLVISSTQIISTADRIEGLEVHFKKVPKHSNRIDADPRSVAQVWLGVANLHVK